MYKLLVCLLSAHAMFCASCASTKVGTASGRPEVMIAGVTREKVHNELVAEFSANGFFVADQNDYSILFSKDSDDMTTNMFFGSSFSATPQWRVRCTTTDRESGVFVTGAVQIVTNPGSGFENATDTSKDSKSAVQIQQVFTRVRDRLAGPPVEEAVPEAEREQAAPALQESAVKNSE